MQSCVTYRPRTTPPPELMPMLLEGTKQWLDRYGDRFKTLQFYPQGGGFGVLDVTDEAEIMQIMAENPFTPYSDVNVQICIEPRTALGIYERMVQDQMAAMGAGAPAR